MTPPAAAALGHGFLAAGSGANDMGPGVLGFLVVAAIGLVLFFLLRSMNKHLRRVRSVRDAGLAPGSRIESGNGAARRGRSAADTGGDATAGGDSLTAGSARRTAGGGAGAADPGDGPTAGGDSGGTPGA